MTIAAGAALLLSGCAGMSDTQQRTLTGGAGGAAGGALIGVVAVALLERLADLAVQAHAARRR